MNGADRFQLFFDSTTRNTTGCGNVIRAKISVAGILPEKVFLDLILSNDAIQFLASVYPKRKWYSTVYKWKQDQNIDAKQILKIHSGKYSNEKFQEILATDCELKPGSTIRLDVFYEDDKTHILFSVNHTLIDYAGIENLLASVSGNLKNLILEKELKAEGSFFKKFVDAVSATSYVAARTSWNIRRLKKNNLQPKPCIEEIVLSKSESAQVKNHLQKEIKSTSLPFFVTSSVSALYKNENLLSDKSGDFFIAVPLNRRPAAFKNVLLANYLSFVYFHIKDSGMTDVKNLATAFNAQMIEQARKKMPEKFISLLELFRFLPPIIYRLWMNLPTKGHSTTFALSILNNSMLEKKSFLGFPVIDVTHYAPVISPPGLNIVFTEFEEQLKIIISYDENRITKQQVQKFITDIRSNLSN